MDLIFRNVRIDDSLPLTDVAVLDGKIVQIAPTIAVQATQEVQGNGNVLIPGFVEGHLHLEKANVMHRKANRSGTLQEAIAVTAELKPTLTREDILERSTQVLRALVQAGSTHVRAHAEFDPSQGFTGLDVVLELRERFRDVIDIQVVAFPQEGILKLPGMKEMMVQAMEKGADVVGGIPYNDVSPLEHIDFVFELAKQYDLADVKEGAVVTAVERNSPAAKANLFVGDVITKVGNKTVRNADEAMAALKEADAKKGVRLYVTTKTPDGQVMSRFVFVRDEK